VFAAGSSKPRAIAPSIPAGRSAMVPSHRHRADPRHRLAVLQQVELELRTLPHEPIPVAVQDGPVVVVLR